MLHRLIVIALMLLSGFAGGQAAAQEAIGTVSRIQGEANATHGSAARALSLGAPVFRNEVVLTGEATRLEITFVDKTRLTLAEKTRLTLNTFVFNPGGAPENYQVRSRRRLPVSNQPIVEVGDLSRQR